MLYLYLDFVASIDTNGEITRNGEYLLTMQKCIGFANFPRVPENLIKVFKNTRRFKPYERQMAINYLYDTQTANNVVTDKSKNGSQFFLPNSTLHFHVGAGEIEIDFTYESEYVSGYFVVAKMTDDFSGVYDINPDTFETVCGFFTTHQKAVKWCKGHAGLFQIYQIDLGETLHGKTRLPIESHLGESAKWIW